MDGCREAARGAPVRSAPVRARFQRHSSITTALAPLMLAGAPRTAELPNGLTGWFIRGARSDDCWAAALATCLQVPIGEVPDPRIDERLRCGDDPEEIYRSFWSEQRAWAAGRGLHMLVHRKVPVNRARWIGLVRRPGLWMDHSLVMSGPDVLFDPLLDFQLPALAAFAKIGGQQAVAKIRTRRWGADDVAVGFSFRKLAR